jgi:hypothetical protein
MVSVRHDLAVGAELRAWGYLGPQSPFSSVLPGRLKPARIGLLSDIARSKPQVRVYRRSEQKKGDCLFLVVSTEETKLVLPQSLDLTAESTS